MLKISQANLDRSRQELPGPFKITPMREAASALIVGMPTSMGRQLGSRLCPQPTGNFHVPTRLGNFGL